MFFQIFHLKKIYINNLISIDINIQKNIPIYKKQTLTGNIRILPGARLINVANHKYAV